MATTLTAILSADLYFILLPKLRNIRRRSEPLCSCGSNNLSRDATPPGLNWTSVSPQLVGLTRRETKDGGSKLEKLFSHPLYNIQTPAVGPEEKLLQEEQLSEYVKKKVTRWERSVRAQDFPGSFMWKSSAWAQLTKVMFSLSGFSFNLRLILPQQNMFQRHFISLLIMSDLLAFLNVFGLLHG